MTEPLLGFITKYSDEADIFCFQEVFDSCSASRETYLSANFNIHSDIQKALPSFDGFFAPHQDNEEGLSMFYKKDLRIIEKGDEFVYKWKNSMMNGDSLSLGRNIQYVDLEYEDKLYTICNFHGLWNGMGKTDTPDRLDQSENINNFLNKKEGIKVLCGDFNLLPETESLKIIEATGLRNLIKEFGIQSTRTSFYKKPGKFADYVFVSPSVEVKEFKILPDEVSDHAPLFLEI